jgi:hypothetical protein
MTAVDDQTDDDEGGPLSTVRKWVEEVVWFLVDLVVDFW